MQLPAALWAAFIPGIVQWAQAAQDIDGKPVLTLGKDTPVDTPGTYWTALHACPKPCGDNGPEKWTVYNSVNRLAVCKAPLLLDFAIYNSLEDKTAVKIHACTIGNSGKGKRSVAKNGTDANSGIAASENCLASTKTTSIPLSLDVSEKATSDANDVLLSLSFLRDHVSKSSCGNTVSFVYVNGTVAGLYSGADIHKSTAASLLDEASTAIKAKGSYHHMRSQICDKNRNANQIVGVTINTQGSLAAVQKDVATWADAKCSQSSATSQQNLSHLQVREMNYMSHHNSNSTSLNTTHPFKTLQARGDCKVITIVAGDTCAKLADRCGISAADFTKYNPKSNFCSTLVPDGRACCSAGTLPDIRPKKNPDGSCASYLVASGDNCSKLAGKYGLTMDDIEGFNKGTTWGWNGCNALLAGMNMCLSDGDPPMPAPVENAVCGPQKPGSKRPTDGTIIEDINPCPLNACCNIWGQCGISGDFCIEKRGPFNNPGTAPPGVNGCVSSCGMNITNDRQPTQTDYGRVGYYETWNMDRPCLKMRVFEANTDGSYTKIHWAFAEINSDWTVKIKDDYDQWDDFKALQGISRILSFGGWGYSTDPATYDILREAMSPANREKFAQNIVSFIIKEGLDGVDFDWEYPGALDIPGTPPGKPDDGLNYLKFLVYLRSLVATSHRDNFSVSIAAPASYWYLKTFPIDKMARFLDYIVYMTYDLHGQWDAGNKFSDEGCPDGNCLRSHVNLTETTIALSMLTKAGVPTNKIFVGESSYGRSFKMAQAGCTGPDCKFLGDRLNSQAKKGRCTGTAGYIANAELNEILSLEDNVQSWHDGASNSDIIVYEDTEWVAYMTDTTKSTRRDHWRGYNFAGTIDWAVDLQDFNDDDDSDWLMDEPTPPPAAKCDGDYSSLDDIPQDAPAQCKNLYILQAMKHDLDDSLKQYNDLLNGGYDDKFNTYADAIINGGREAIENFMFTKSGDYFDCVVTETVQCCKSCNDIRGDGSKECMYCDDQYCGDYTYGCENYGTCHFPPPGYKNITVGCTDWSKRNEDPPIWQQQVYNQATTYWTLRDNKADAFWKDIYLATGIDKNNIQFQTVERYPCDSTTPPDDCINRYHDINFPVTHNYKKEDIANPEDLIKKGYGKLEALGPQMGTAIDQIKSGTFFGNTYDLVDATSLSIQMVSDSVDNMQTISDTVDEWDAETRKSVILAFITAIFLVIPVLGEVAGSLSAVASIAKIAAIVGVVGNTALDIYSIVDDPSNAPLAIFSLVLEPLSLVDVAKMAKAGSLRREMTPDDLKKLHPGSGSKLDKIDELRNVCVSKSKRSTLMGSIPMSSLHGVKYDAVAF